MTSQQEKKQVELCPRCGEEYDGILCKKCGYTPYPEDEPESEVEEYVPYIPFPRNIVSLPLYIVAIIFIIVMVCIGTGTISGPGVINWILIGIICLAIGLGRGIRLIYMCLESIWELTKRKK